MPLFSVVIPSHNRMERLREAVRSVLSQTFRDFECVVVDDGSTDGTVAMAEELRGPVRFIRQENRGVSAARNRGILSSRAPYLAFLDSDDLWLPDKLEAHRAYLKMNPSMRIHQSDETWVRKGRRVNPREKHIKPEGDIFLPSLRLCLVSPSAVVIERGLLEEVGLFDERLPVCEDYDLWLRISWRERVGLMPGRLVIKHGGHDDQLSKRYWGMARCRIYSILTPLAAHAGELRPDQRARAREVVVEKCRILHGGALKRGNSVLAETMQRIIRAVGENGYSNIDFQTLLEG